MFRTTKLFAFAVSSLVAVALPQVSRAVTVSTFTDTTGLDLSGSFIVAEDTNYSGADYAVGVLNFTAQSYFVNSPGNGAYSSHTWADAGFSDTSLNTLMRTINYSGDAGPAETVQGPMIAAIPVNLGQTYKVQLILWEGDGSREDWNVTIEGNTLSNFDPLAYTGNAVTPGAGVLLTQTFTATDTVLNISIASVTNDSATSSVMLNAFTVEAFAPVPEPASLSLLALGGVAMLRRRVKR